MRKILWFSILALTGVACGTAVSEDDKKSGDAKGVEVALDKIKARTPAEWKEEEPANKMRFMNFRLAKADGDKLNGEVIIFNSASGGVKQNVNRWKGLFSPPEGKTIDDVTKVEEIKVGGLDATRVHIKGTYKAPPFDPTFKGANDDFEMVAIYLEGPEKVYQIRMIGPAKTVAKNRKAFDEWIKAFK